MTDEEEDDTLDRVQDMADRLGLKGNDRRKYVHDHMTRVGYRMEPTYVRGDDNDDDNDEEDDTPFFTTSRRRGNRSDTGDRRTRSRSRQTGTRSTRRGADDWYSG